MTVYLNVGQATALQGEALSQFGGLPGIKDRAALESALAQPAMEAFGVELYPGDIEKAAAYLFFVARNHAFNDGNKRTAYLCAAVFLLENGWTLVASDDELFALVLDAAQGRLADVRALVSRLQPMVSPLL